METTDKTILEMQQQMQLLKEKLDSQEIVNDKMLWNAALELVVLVIGEIEFSNLL